MLVAHSNLALSKLEKKQADFQILEQFDSVTILISDSAVGGCWPDPKQTKVKLEKQFLTSGVKVGKGTTLPIIITVVGIPAKAGSQRLGCASAVKFEARYAAAVSAPNVKIHTFLRSTIEHLHFEQVLVYQALNVLLYPNNAQTHINRVLGDLADQFIVHWLKVKQ